MSLFAVQNRSELFQFAFIFVDYFCSCRISANRASTFKQLTTSSSRPEIVLDSLTQNLSTLEVR